MSRPPNETNAFAGLDWLRIFAVGMVTFQHCASLTERDDLTNIGPVNIGQLGVAVFLGISAFLGAVSSRPPLEWLFQRFRRIYPSYWAAMFLSFSLVWISGYKSFSAGQFLSQMLGTGLFTHPTQLVNVPTWFISILLVCYLGLFAARVTPWPGFVCIALAFVACWWCIDRQQNWPWMHAVAFFATAATTYSASSRYRVLALASVATFALVAGWISTLFAYVGLSLIVLCVGLLIGRTPPIVARLSSVSYEYYLVHGITLVGATALFPDASLLAIAVGVSGAVCLAVLLRMIVKRVGQFLELRLSRHPAGAGGPM